MNFNSVGIKKALKDYDALYNKIKEIIDLHSDVDNCYYEIISINHEGITDGIGVDVQYYKWQDNNYSNIYIEYELLTDPLVFERFKSKMLGLYEARKSAELQKAEDAKQKAIDAAVKLLKDNGINQI